MRQEPPPPPPPPVRPPTVLLDPVVEDWVSRDEAPPATDGCVLNRRRDESDLAWRYRELADRRFLAAWKAFRAEHAGRRIELTVQQRRRELLGDGTRWRDMRGFLTRETRP